MKVDKEMKNPCRELLNAGNSNVRSSKLSYFKTSAGDADSKNLYKFISCTVSGSRLFQLGYETLGPLLYGFCQWLHERKVCLGLDKLLFLSRDGQIIKMAYDIIYPSEDTQYIYISRRGITVPFIHFYDNLYDALEIIPLYRYTLLCTLLEIIGIDWQEHTGAIEKNGLNPGDCFTREQIFNDKKLESLFSDLHDVIYENSANEYAAFKEYIESLNLDKTGIVDLGWTGRIQTALEKLVPSIDKSIKLHGLYMGIALDKSRADGYLYDRENTKLKISVRGFIGFFETLFSADHGSLKRYLPNKKVELFDFEYETDNDLKKTYEEIVELQRGGLAFVKGFTGSSISKQVVWKPSLAFRGIYNLGVTPSCSDLNRMGDWCFLNNNKLYRLAHPSKDAYLHLSCLKKDFSTSYWKIGYLKRLLKIPLPYLRLYKFLYKRINP